MAEKPESNDSKKPAKGKETLRQRTERAASEASKPKVRRIKSTAQSASRPFKALHRFGKKEYYLPLPDNKVGRFLNKKRRATPRYFVEAWRELRQVVWPDKKTTLRLTLAVFIFAIMFGLLIAVVDFGLDKVFKKVFID